MMKINLMYQDQDFLPMEKEPEFRDAVFSDLELYSIIEKMAEGDDQIKKSCSDAFYLPLQTVDEIKYRQETFSDCLANKDKVRKIYDILSETKEKEKDFWLWLTPDRFLSTTFESARNLLTMYLKQLSVLKKFIEKNGESFTSKAFRSFFKNLQEELSDKYVSDTLKLLRQISLGEGIYCSCNLGSENQQINYILRRRPKKTARQPVFPRTSYTIAEESAIESEDIIHRENLAINECTNDLGQAADFIAGYISLLYRETAFYIGALNLYEYLHTLGMTTCMPVVTEYRRWKNLYDISLAVIKKQKVNGNDLDNCNKKLYIITGANQGGKTTFLRSLGQAQIMMQSGIFTGAEQFSSPIKKEIMTHFTREEDRAMDSGKLDEELTRMEKISKFIKPGSLMFFNESFASTSEREGAEILRQITQAFIERQIEVFSVTHLYTYASSFKGSKDTLYLRAQRLDNGERTFKIIEGEPLKTAFGEDLYKKIFENGNS